MPDEGAAGSHVVRRGAGPGGAGLADPSFDNFRGHCHNLLHEHEHTFAPAQIESMVRRSDDRAALISSGVAQRTNQAETACLIENPYIFASSRDTLTGVPSPFSLPLLSPGRFCPRWFRGTAEGERAF